VGVWECGPRHYTVIEYKDVEGNKDRLLALGRSRDDAFKNAKGCLFLVEGDPLVFFFNLKLNARVLVAPTYCHAPAVLVKPLIVSPL